MGRYPANGAEAVMTFTPIAGLRIVAKLFLAGQKSKISWVQLTCVPHALFPAHLAVALAGAFFEVDVGFKGNSLAVAASVKSPFHRSIPIR
jgi:hypothetical protein